MAIEESKDLTSLSLDELIGNLKAKKESSDEECSTSESEDKNTPWRRSNDKNGKSDRKCFRCDDPNHLIGECPKQPKDKNQRAFVEGSWSDSGEDDDEKAKDDTCLIAQASNEICLGVDLEPDEWIEDSRCSKHMTGNRKLFSSYKACNRGNVIFGSNLRGNIIGKGQICDNICRVTFSEHDSETTKDGKVIGRESLNMKFDEIPPPFKTSPLVDDDLDEEEAINVTGKKILKNDIEDETLKIDEIVNIKESRSHSLENVTGNLNQRTLRPDIMFSVCICAHFQEAPKTSHLEAVKRIFLYIKGTTHLGLWYPKGIGIETVLYVDSDHAGDYVDRKSTSGICTFVGCCLTSWFSKKQTALAISTTEAEYVSAGKACQQALWMKQAFIDYDVRLDDVPIM
uniref:Copia protein n=1 Tax=Tanacetum cinerariifolium TaxID=118510 RepID=A0A6L2LS26_TANCI|nr:copia protein [Tanacetum cinerariifolium]